MQTIDYNNGTNIADLDDMQTIDYTNRTNITDLDDVETINYNNDTSASDLIDLKKTSGTQLAAKKKIKKIQKQLNLMTSILFFLIKVAFV